MNMGSSLQRHLTSSMLFNLLILGALLTLAACGTFEVGIERTVAPDDMVTPTAEIPVTESARSTPFMATPTPTPMPVQPLHVAFVKEGDVWLWMAESEESEPLTRTGGVGDGAIRISDDGAIVAFTRGYELWTINADGTGERTLVSEADFDAMEPTDPGVSLYRFDWVPGTHVLAFNTRLRMEIGLVLNDDLRMVNADTLERTILLPPGEGGEFYYSPDGRRIAIVTAGIINLVDADGENRREAFTYTPVATASEFYYYVRPIWAADSRSLRVAVPPVEPHAQPPQLTSIWHIPTDGTPARLVATVMATLGNQLVFSPDLTHAAYLEQPEGALPGSSQGSLLITDLDSSETITYYPQAHNIYGWTPNSEYFAFLTNPQLPQAQIGQLGSDAVPAYADADADAAVIDVRWVDANRYLFLAQSARGWDIVLGQIGGISTFLAAVVGRPPSYDFAP